MRGFRQKRLLVAGLAAALLVAGLAVIAATFVFRGPPGPAWAARSGGTVTHAAVEIPARIAVRIAERIASSVACEASAQGRMQFESTPEESARAFDRRIAQRRAARSAEPAPAGVPTPPAVDNVDEPTPPIPPSSSGDIVRIGSDIKVEEGQTVDGDVVVFGADARVDGHVRGNVSVTRGDLYLGSTAKVDGDVLCFGGEIHEEDGATVTGQRVTGLQRGRHVTRTRTHIGRDIDEEFGFSRAAKVVRRLSYLLVWLLIAWALARFAPGRTTVALETLRRESSASFGWGFALMLLLIPSVVALALVVAILCITIIGIPVAIGVLFAYVGLLIVGGGWGYVVGATALGERLSTRGGVRPTLMRSAITGVLAIQGTMVVTAMLGGLPIIGWMASLVFVIVMVTFSVVTLLGIGALIRSKFGLGPQAVWWPPNRLFGGGTPPSAYPPPPPPPAGYVPPPVPYGQPGAPQTWPPAPPQTWAQPGPPPGYTPPAAPPGYSPPATPPGYTPPAAPPPGYGPPQTPPGYPPPAPPSPEPPPSVG